MCSQFEGTSKNTNIVFENVRQFGRRLVFILTNSLDAKKVIMKYLSVRDSHVLFDDHVSS